MGKITGGTEVGWGEAVNREGVAFGRQGIVAAAIRHGQLRGEIKPIGAHADGTQKMATIVDADCYTSDLFEGHYEEVLPCGIRVKKGDVVGRLHDFDRIDEPAWPVRGGVEGVIVGQAWGARVIRGQHIVCVGQIVG